MLALTFQGEKSWRMKVMENKMACSSSPAVSSSAGFKLEDEPTGLEKHLSCIATGTQRCYSENIWGSGEVMALAPRCGHRALSPSRWQLCPPRTSLEAWSTQG